MKFNFPEGSKFYFSQTFAAAKTLTAITNANPGVATSVAHGFADGDVLMYDSPWEDLSGMVIRVDGSAADSYSLEGVDTTDQRYFPAGSGAGTTVQKVTNWVEMPQVLTVSTSGGDPAYTDIALLARRNAIKVPTGFNATETALSLAHDPDNASWQQMLSISRALSPIAFKMVLGGGGVSYGYGYMACSEQPKLNRGSVNSVDVAIAFLGRTIAYGS